MNKLKKLMVGFIVCTVITAAVSATAYAYTDVDGKTDTNIKSSEEESTTSKSTGPSLTPEGNLTLVDDIGGANQQFVTLVTKSGNTFYLIIDRSDNGKENVYFLNLVDEADLFALLEKDKQKLPQTSSDTDVSEKTSEKEEEKTATEEPNKTEKENGNMLPIIVILLMAVAGGGYFYLKSKKKKAETRRSDPDDDYDEAYSEDDVYDIPESTDDEDYFAEEIEESNENEKAE